MFNDTPGIAVLRFIPAYSQSKCPAIIPLLMNIVALLAICFAPAYASDMVNTLGMWSLWVWMGLVASVILIAAAIMPRPEQDTYIVYATSKDDISVYANEFDIEPRVKRNTYRLTRKYAP